jgi:O-antigen/teichoic acid export membrane protein
VLGDGLKRRSFAVRYLTLFGGEVTSKLAVLFAFAYLARALGPGDFGAVELAVSTTVLVVLAAELGLGSYGARVVETSPEVAAQLVPRAGLLRFMLAVPAYLLLVLLSSAYGAAGHGVLAVYGVVVLLTPFNTQWVFQGLRQMQWVAAGSLLRYGTFAVLVFLLVRPGTDPRLVAVAEVAGALVLALFNSTILNRVLRVRFDWAGAWRGAVGLFRETWFLGGSDLAWMTMWLSPAIVIGWIDPSHPERVAWIAAALRIVIALHTFVWLYFFNLLPNLSRELHKGPDAWRALVERSMSISTWPACLLAVGGTLIAPLLLPTVFGQAYHEAVLPFQIAVWMIPVAWLSGHFRFSLIAAGRQDLDFVASGLGAATVVILAVAAGPAYGAPGVAAALLSAGVVNACSAGVWMHRVIGPVRMGILLPGLVTGLLTLGAGLFLAGRLGSLAGSVIACAAYALVAASRLDLAQIRDAWEGRS